MNPNLQQTPNKFIFLDSKGKKFEINLRKSFYSRSGYYLLSADYCQIEIRILGFF
jgi:DNA polymerase I-like protein with 3'-5' exonuclease and polymerase domains